MFLYPGAQAELMVLAHNKESVEVTSRWEGRYFTVVALYPIQVTVVIATDISRQLVCRDTNRYSVDVEIEM